MQPVRGGATTRPAGERPPVSAFLISYNEENRIARAIASVRDWVEEVVVVDSGSTDATCQIAADMGARVLQNPWPGYGAQKRFAEDNCVSRWLFNLDADEEVSAELAEEIAALFVGREPEKAGYRVFIADVFPHEDKPAAWASGKWQIRLYNRDRGRFADSTVHDAVRLEKGARSARLNHILHHRSQPSLGFAVEKMNRYTDLQVADMQTRGRRLSRWRLLCEFPVAMLKCYILRRAFLYGSWGFIHAVNYGFFRHLRLAKLYEAELMMRQHQRR